MSKLSRRDLLQFIGAGGIGAVGGVLYGESVERDVEFLIPHVVPPEDYSPGIATWYNSVCHECPAGCGISVRTREGRAKIIQGNPVHPVSQGKICPRGQAGLNALYNPDRIRAPLRVSDGSGEFGEIGWDEALTSVARLLGELKIAGRAESVWLLTGRIDGHLDQLFSQFMTLLGSEHYQQYDFTYPSALQAANRLSFGTEVLAYYDIRNADYLLSFGADYLAGWISPVHHGLAYGHMRQGRQGRRGKTVQIEPRMSLSGANADEWIAARPGSEGLLALSIGYVLVDGGFYRGDDRAAWQDALSAYAPGRVAVETQVPAARIEALAAEFGRSDAALAVAGGAVAAGTGGVASIVAVNALNHLADNLGKPGGVIFNPSPALPSAGATRQAGLSGMREFVDAATAGQIEVLLVHDTNPVFNLPDAVGIRGALEQVPLVVAMSTFRDETTEMADIILPTHHYLESWGDSAPDPGVGFPVASISQPVVAPLYDTLPVGDIVLSLARQIGGELPVEMHWSSMETFIKASWEAEYQRRETGAGERAFEQFWRAALEAGVWGEPGAPRRDAPVDRAAAVAAVSRAGDPLSTFAGEESEYPYVLHPFLTSAFHDGRGANLPWMQELPDPLTSVVYGTWVELNPATAADLGIVEGDVLEIRTQDGAVQAPALIYPAIHPAVIAMPIGQGHRSYGRYAGGRGVNPIDIVAPQADPLTGDLAWAATRAAIRKTGERQRIIKTAGDSRTLGRQILGPDEGHA